MQALVVDDHALIRSGLARLLSEVFDGISVIEAQNGDEAMDKLASTTSDLAIVDLFIPGEAHFSCARRLCDAFPRLTVVIISATENPAYIRKCIDIGASGFIPKSFSPEQMTAALRDIMAGRVFIPQTLLGVVPAAIAGKGDLPPGLTRDQITSLLTPRQLEILALLAEGRSNKAIARACELSENTIKVHVSAILRALGLGNRAQAGLLMQKLGTAEPPPP